MDSKHPPCSLTDLEQTRLRLEESYRHAVRSELEGRIKKPSRYIAFLNSGLGLWLLSAIFISGAGSLLTSCQNTQRERVREAEAKRLEEQRTSDLTQRIDLEISYRFSLAMSRLKIVDQRTPKSNSAGETAKLKNAVAPLTSPMNDSMPPLYPEFRQFSGLALIAELRRHVSEGERVRLKKVLASLTGLVGGLDGEPSVSKVTSRGLASELVTILSSPRWDNGFHYNDCPATDPFC